MSVARHFIKNLVYFFDDEVFADLVFNASGEPSLTRGHDRSFGVHLLHDDVRDRVQDLRLAHALPLADDGLDGPASVFLLLVWLSQLKFSVNGCLSSSLVDNDLSIGFVQLIVVVLVDCNLVRGRRSLNLYQL